MPPSRDPVITTMPVALSRLPLLAKVMLWLDTLACGVRALIALGVLGIALGLLRNDSDSRGEVLLELALVGGIGLFGLTGNLLLLRGRRAGLVPACIALVFTAADLLRTPWTMAARAGSPDLASCPPEVLVIAALYIGMRLLLNGLYVAALREVRARYA